VDHGDAEVTGVAGIVDLDRLAQQENLPAIGLDRPRQHLHQGALARAILPNQRQHLTLPQREVDPLQRLYAGVGLGDASHCE
jgi:hypothetical protein